jgi:superfamily I DNA/RNA helicase
VDVAPPTVGSASASSVDAETLALEWVLTDLVEREGIRPEQILVVTCRGGDGRSKAPTRWRVREQQQLGRRTLEWLRSTRSPTRIALGTIRSSKGLESPVVVLAELDGLARDAKHDQLLYTAISRAKHQLIVLAPPEALAPRQSGLWERFGSDPSEPTTLAGATATSDDPALVSPDDAAPEVDRDLASDAAPPAASLARSARAEVARATSARADQANAQAVVGQPSSYQQAIFDFVQHGQGDGIVDAVAGSGKTTTLVAAAARLETRSAIFLAFNRHVAEVLRQRLRGTPMVAKTIHGIGFVTLTRYLAAPLHLDPHKYAKLCRRAARTAFASLGPAHQRQVADTLTELVNLARLTLTPAAEGARMRTLAGHHDVSCDAAPLDHLLRLVPELLTYGVRMAEADPNDTDRSDDGGGGSGGTGQTTAEAEQPWHVIDYTDMLYLPYVWQLPARWRSDWVFVDEAQDLNAAQLDLALKCRAPGGRVLFVGDPHQAIYGFSGADTAAFTAIQHATGAKAFPLSISYRCPKRHVALARDLVPQIESRPDAEEGIVEHIDPTQVPSLVQRGDLILCRKTAPLVELCITLLRHRVHAHVAGREIGTGLSQVVEDVTQLDGYTWQRFGHSLDEYQHQQTAKLRHVDNAEREIERLQDRVEALRTCYVLFPARDAADLCQRIDDLFREERPQVTLSTVHRAKGLEADRVFILQPEAMPLRWPNQQPWELEQEDNIKYVALTRARKALYLVASPAS